MRNWQAQSSALAARILAMQRAPVALKEAAWKLLSFALRCRRSHPVSFALRPVVTHKYWRFAAGATMALAAIIGAVVLPNQSLASPNTGGSTTVQVLPVGEVTIETTSSVVPPVTYTYISQGFWPFHPGIDLATALGTPINPIMNGKVASVSHDKWDYGNHVVITHANNVDSLYAHMGKVSVTAGQDVTTGTVIGEVGLSGRTTGPHLHLEIHDEGRAVNPAQFLGIK